MVGNEEILNCGEIKIEPINFIEIDEMKIIREINEHVIFKAMGRIDEQDKDNYTRELNFGTEIIVKDKYNSILFRGLITETEMEHQGGFYSLRVQGSSHTMLLDMKKKTRPFHDVKEMYTDIFQSISAEYTGTNAIISDIYMEETGQFLMQYVETDWEFLKRLASHKQQGIFADSTLSHPAYYIGTPQLYADVEKLNGRYQIKKDLISYQKALESSKNTVYDVEYITYTLSFSKWLNLGEEITYNGLKLYVKSACSVLQHAEFIHNYELCVKEGLNQNKQYNEHLSGKSVKGMVEDVNRDCVKVQVDNEQEKSCWFSYSTVYASKDGSGWYCMPEKGDKVRILFPDADEKNAYAVSSISEYQPNSTKRDRMENYQRRYIRNPQGMEVEWTPEQINISANGACVATLDQNGVLTLSANSKILLHSKGDISLESGNQVKINASDSINMICGGKGEINISQDGIIELKGNQVYTN